MKTEVIELDADTHVRKVTVGPMRFFEYNGQTYAAGLFRMHDERGFSLADSMIQCKRFGIIPCLKDFEAEALAAGWSPQKVERAIREAQSDSRTA